MYNAGNADMFHLWVVMSIVKNRSGVDSIDLGFRKRFERSRPNGRCRRRPKRLSWPIALRACSGALTLSDPSGFAVNGETLSLPARARRAWLIEKRALWLGAFAATWARVNGEPKRSSSP